VGGEAIRQESREARCRASGERLDEPGARRPKTRRAGRLCANLVGKRLVRTASPACAAFLDLVTKSLRQNASSKA
jgi:hypothetical protein